MNTFTEENYLKAIYKLSKGNKSEGVPTNAIADLLNTKASSVTDMLQKLAEKGLVNYQKYQGATLTAKGRQIAIKTVRKHRLWEVFLVERLNFKWDEVHEVAEELEHINSDQLINNLDKFLGYPKFDPHGDPIPDKDGNIHVHKEISLADLKPGQEGIMVGVKEDNAKFLQYLESIQLILGAKVKVIKHYDYDDSIHVLLNKKQELTLSNKVSSNIYIKTTVTK